MAQGHWLHWWRQPPQPAAGARASAAKGRQGAAAGIALAADGVQLVLTCLLVSGRGMQGYAFAFTLSAELGAALSWRPLMSYTASVWKFLSAFTPWMAVACPVDTLLAAFTTVPSL